MRRKIGFLVLCLFVTLSCFAQQHSQLINTKFRSTTLGVEREYAIYLPPNYKDSGKSYPVLYLLHGAWNNFTAWATIGNMKQITDETTTGGMALEMIVVMPDAKGIAENNTGKNMGYFNVPGWPYEDYFFDEFIPYIDKTYRTRSTKQGRAVAGLSMGGGGTTVYAQHRPDMFGSACCLSGLIGNTPESLAKQLDKEFTKSVDNNNTVNYVLNATPQQLEALRSVRWYFDCGDDDFLYRGNIEMYMAMREKNVPLQFRMRDGGHSWAYWQSALPQVLQFCSIGFSE